MGSPKRPTTASARRARARARASGLPRRGAARDLLELQRRPAEAVDQQDPDTVPRQEQAFVYHAHVAPAVLPAPDPRLPGLLVAKMPGVKTIPLPGASPAGIKSD